MLINKTDMEKKFKPFDKVLVRLFHNQEWQCDLYSHQDQITKHHATVGFAEVKEDNIFPYEGNEHLVGTTDSPDEEVRLEDGEWIFVSTQAYKIDEDWCFGRFKGITPSNSSIILKGLSWRYAIRFKDFDPSNMEETRKHILCVKDGRIIRYKD